MSKPACWLECITCAAGYGLTPVLQGCPKCAGVGRRSPVEVRYELQGKSGPDGEQLSGMWRWQRWLPVAAEQIVSLGEGATPLRPLATPGSGSLYLKNETANPTWSWKDRSISVSVSMARALGFTRIAAESTGNHGVAASAY